MIKARIIMIALLLVRSHRTRNNPSLNSCIFSVLFCLRPCSTQSTDSSICCHILVLFYLLFWSNTSNSIAPFSIDHRIPTSYEYWWVIDESSVWHHHLIDMHLNESPFIKLCCTLLVNCACAQHICIRPRHLRTSYVNASYELRKSYKSNKTQ